MKGILIAISGATILMSSMVYGQPDTPVIDQREMNQEHWVERSFDRGELNRREPSQLNREEGRIGRMEEKTQADGVMRRKEGARIGAAQKRPSRHILREQHNRQGAQHR